MSIHVTDFMIKEYRGLKDIGLEGFNSINVFTGKNNSGKTSILELLGTLDNPLWGESWFNSIFPRQAGLSLFDEFKRMVPVGNTHIGYSAVLSDNRQLDVDLSEEIVDTMVTNRELMRLNGYIQTGAKKHENEIPYAMKQIQIQINTSEGGNNSFGIYEGQTAINTKGSEKKVFIPSIYLAPTSRSTNISRILEPIITDNEIHRRVIDMLKIYDNDIEGISVLNNEFIVNNKKNNYASPIGIYGDGVKRAILIMGVIANARNGLSMIDEFETAIHMSAIKDTFLHIITEIERYDVQLFLSSHSKDAITELLTINDKIRDMTNIYTLHSRNGKTLVRRMNGKEALNANSWGIDLI